MIKLNLLPALERKYFQILRIEKYLIYSFFCLLAGCLLSIGALVFLKYTMEKNLNLLKNQIQGENSKISSGNFQAKIKETNAMLKTFNTLSEKKNFVLPIMADIFALTPAELNYKKMTFEKNDFKIVLFGIAEKREKLLEFQHNLEKLAGVKKINTPLSNLEKEERGEFLIEIYLEDL